MKTTCDICKDKIELGYYEKHLFEKHNISKLDAFAMRISKTNILYDVPQQRVIELVRLHDFRSLGKVEQRRVIKRFASFYKMISSLRNYSASDTENFVKSVLPWRYAHPQSANSIELCKIIFPHEPEMADKLYNMMLLKNPYHNHDGKLSPFSKNFVGYSNLTDEEKQKRIKKCLRVGDPSRYIKNIEFWKSRGYTEDEAVAKIHESQKTFSLQKCISKYGEEEGRRVWGERQRKWMESYKKQNYSRVSQTLFWPVYETIKDKISEIYFATLNQETKKYETTNQNNEYSLTLNGKTIKPDFIALKEKKIIEFDGDYWHSQKARGNQKRDEERNKLITSNGYQVLHIQEKNFKKNPAEEIKKCISFILESEHETNSI